MTTKYNHTFVKLVGKQKENNNLLIFTFIVVIIFCSFLFSTALTIGIEHLHFSDGCFLFMCITILGIIIFHIYYKNSIYNFITRENSYINFKKHSMEFKNTDNNLYNACYSMETRETEVIITENNLKIYKNNKLIHTFIIDSEYLNKDYLRSLDYILFVY